MINSFGEVTPVERAINLDGPQVRAWAKEAALVGLVMHVNHLCRQQPIGATAAPQQGAALRRLVDKPRIVLVALKRQRLVVALTGAIRLHGFEGELTFLAGYGLDQARTVVASPLILLS